MVVKRRFRSMGFLSYTGCYDTVSVSVEESSA